MSKTTMRAIELIGKYFTEDFPACDCVHYTHNSDLLVIDVLQPSDRYRFPHDTPVIARRALSFKDGGVFIFDSDGNIIVNATIHDQVSVHASAS